MAPPVPNSEADYYRLRTEWLRFKSQLFDRLTGLPALPVVIDDVRHLLESQGPVDVVYMDLGRSGRHENKLGWSAYDQALGEFARQLRELKDAGVLSSEDILCLYTVRSDRFLVFIGAGEVDPLDAARTPAGRQERLVSTLRDRIATLPAAGDLAMLRLAAGHARIVLTPQVRVERAIHQAVSNAMFMSLVEREGVEAVRHEELGRMILEHGVRTVFHPIVRLADRHIIGHEALSRPLASTSFDSVEELFAFAESTELLMEFERLCRRTAIEAAAGVPNLGLLFLNASSHAVEDPDWASGVVERALAQSQISADRVVVEITERVAITRHDDFQRALRTFKDRGYKVAVDDMGAGYSSFQALAHIEPDFLKFDVSLVRDIDRSSIKRSLLDSLRQLGEKIGARVIAEGVEREGEMNTLLELGVELGQGFYFHKED